MDRIQERQTPDQLCEHQECNGLRVEMDELVQVVRIALCLLRRALRSVGAALADSRSGSKPYAI